MLGALATDAIFCAALFFETLAALSILNILHLTPLREEFEPVLAFYHTQISPVIGVVANLVPVNTPRWFVDAYVIAAVLFFLFFIAQARRAMAPYDGEFHAGPDERPERVETAVDWFLPVAFCAFGALLLALTLLPFLTLPVAIWLLGKKLFGAASWFQVSASYYVNIAVVIAATALIVSLPK